MNLILSETKSFIVLIYKSPFITHIMFYQKTMCFNSFYIFRGFKSWFVARSVNTET